MRVALLNGFQPVLGNSFTILTTTFGNVGGQFDTVLLPTIAGLTFNVSYNPKSVVLQVVESTGLPGDYNADGTVNAADYVAWRKNDGTPAGYDTWRMHFGETLGSGPGATGSASAAVPEPTSRLVLILGMLPILFRRRAGCLCRLVQSCA